MRVRDYLLAIAGPAIMVAAGSAVLNYNLKHDRCERQGMRFTMTKMDDPFYHTELRLGYRGFIELDTPILARRHRCAFCFDDVRSGNGAAGKKNLADAWRSF